MRMSDIWWLVWVVLQVGGLSSSVIVCISMRLDAELHCWVIRKGLCSEYMSTLRRVATGVTSQRWTYISTTNVVLNVAIV
ncbi:hypothetical protein BD289DRAFT_442153, partial [Coniella lustricola]